MKKILSIFTIFIFLSLLSSCNKKLDIVEEKTIVLGEKVETQTINVNNEVITIDENSDFYETINKLNNFKGSVKSYKASYDAKYKIENEKEVYVNMNSYYYINTIDAEDFYFCEIRAQKEDSNDVGEFLDYSYSKRNVLESKYSIIKQYTKYSYLSEKSFGGNERIDGKLIYYNNNRIPMTPDIGTELAKMQSSAMFIKRLYQNTAFMRKYADVEVNNETLNYNQYVKKEIKLYENYIVFEESSPLINNFVGSPFDTYTYYLQSLNTKNFVTQTAYYNIKTGQFDCFCLYGKTYDSKILRRLVELDIKTYLHTLDKEEVEKKVDDLVGYVKRKSN